MVNADPFQTKKTAPTLNTRYGELDTQIGVPGAEAFKPKAGSSKRSAQIFQMNGATHGEHVRTHAFSSHVLTAHLKLVVVYVLECVCAGAYIVTWHTHLGCLNDVIYRSLLS